MGFSIIAILLVSFACTGQETYQAPPLPPYSFSYDLGEPGRILEMENELEEISGLSIGMSDQQLLAVQDEDGVIFFLDHDDKDIQYELTFWKDGDYEGIERVGEDIYVVNSSGSLFRVQGTDESHLRVDKFNGFLSSGNDVEGLGYDPVHNRLLLACKGRAGKGDQYTFKKAVYGFSLDSMAFQREPVYLISLQDVQAYLSTSPTVRKLEKLIDYFSLDKSEMVFSPSGIAVHPQTGNHYIISSVGKLLMVLSPEGQILHLEKLKSKVHPQPEGICFDSEGTMYISNEGRGEDGTIQQFRLLN